MTVSPSPKLYESMDVTISSGQSITDAINLRGRILGGIFMPSGWTAANLTFQAAPAEAGTFVDLYGTDEAELEITAAASRYMALDSVNWGAVNFPKVRSGTSAAAVNQAVDRTLTLMLGVLDRG